MKTNEPIEIDIHIPTSYMHKVDYVSTTQQQQQLDSAIYIVDDPTYINTRSVHNKRTKFYTSCQLIASLVSFWDWFWTKHMTLNTDTIIKLIVQRKHMGVLIKILKT